MAIRVEPSAPVPDLNRRCVAHCTSGRLAVSGTIRTGAGPPPSAKIPPVEDDSDWPMLAVKLNAWEASKVAEVLMNLAALIDADDPDGLRNAYGQRADQHLLTDTQFVMLCHPAYRSDERAEVASYLRRISARVEGQLPDEAPEVGRRHDGPRH